jgi:hypothetical protein
VFEDVRAFTSAGADFEEFEPLPDSAPRHAKVLAYYLPQFHTVPENDRWWGRGFTEWTSIARGMPRFTGHYQPRTPRDLGYYSLDCTETMRRQIAMARAAGLYGFVHYFIGSTVDCVPNSTSFTVRCHLMPHNGLDACISLGFNRASSTSRHQGTHRDEIARRGGRLLTG